MKKFNRYDVDVDYINMETFADKLFGVLKTKRDDMRRGNIVVDAYMKHTENLNDEYVRSEAERFAYIINNEVEKSLGKLCWDFGDWITLEAYCHERNVSEEESEKIVERFMNECKHK